MTINESSKEYYRQIDLIRSNNLQAQKNANKQILIFAGTMFTIISTMLILSYFNLIHLS